MPDQSSRTRGLIPFQKGQSGNPGGRPRGPKLSTLIAQELEKPSAPGSEITKAQLMAQKLVAMALSKDGDLPAIKEVIDRLEGKAVGRQETGQPGEFTGLEDVPTADLLKMVKRQV